MAANGNSKPTVTVAGGGIAGIAAALRLGQTGEYEVTLYEEKNVLGGNLASGLSQHVAKFQPLGVVEPEEILDVYPHMYQAWYVNFWQLLKDAGVKGVKLTEAGTPEELDGFVRFSEFHQLSRRDAGVRGKQPAKARIRTLVYPYSARYVLQNLASGLAPPADLFAAGYAGLDLQAERMNPTIRLQNTSLTGYLNSRMYMSRAAIAAYETLISTVWGIPAYLISAADYRTYSGYCYGAAEEDSWLTNGPAIEAFMDALEKALKKAKVKVVLNTSVTAVGCDPPQGKKPGSVRTITIAKATFEKAKDRWKVGSPQKRQVENLILAVPPKPLAKLVHQGMPNNPIDAAVPRLRELKRIGSERIPMLHLVFKQNRFEDELPKEPVALLGSTLSLTFIDISQTWQGAIPPRLVGRKVLAVACSEPAMLPGGADREAEAEADAHAIADELKEYLDFTDDDVDEKLTRYRPDTDVRLSVNAIGTDTIRPPAHFDEVKGLFFAGDFCQNDFGITTIEAAVATGLAAAQAVVKSCGVGKVPDIKIPATLPDSEFVAMRYAWLPFAYGARAVSFAAEDEGSPAAGEAAQSVQQGREDGKAMLRYLLTPGLRPLP